MECSISLIGTAGVCVTVYLGTNVRQACLPQYSKRSNLPSPKHRHTMMHPSRHFAGSKNRRALWARSGRVAMSDCQCPPRDCADLVRRAVAGDRTAGDELARTFEPFVRSIVCRTLGGTRRSDWDDAVQIAFMKLFRNLKKWRQECPFCAFVAVVVSRQCLDLLRAERNERANAPLPVTDPPDHRCPPVTDTLVQQLEAALACFPENWQEAWRQSLEGVPQDEIASRVGRATRTVRLWIAAIRDRLAEVLNEDA
jgi:RNA polymerase sigma factor (sigma-70 family)